MSAQKRSRQEKGWRKAFYVAPEKGDPEFTERQLEILDKIACKIAEKRMEIPALMFLETMKPVTFISSQLMVFLNPFVQTLFESGAYEELSRMMEDRRTVEELARRIEAFAGEFEAKRRGRKKEEADPADPAEN